MLSLLFPFDPGPGVIEQLETLFSPSESNWFLTPSVRRFTSFHVWRDCSAFLRTVSVQWSLLEVNQSSLLLKAFKGGSKVCMFLLRHRPYFTMNIHCLQRAFSSAPSSLVPLQLPSPMETHFWYVLPEEVKSANLVNQYLELLSPCERDNVLGMRGDQLKRSALLARVLVRTTIARYTNFQVDPKSLKFRKNRYGKPEVDWQTEDGWLPPPLHFNISHTSSLIACGVTVDSPIGIDVEEKNRKLKNHILAFARRYFSSCELEHLTVISDPEIQRQEFMKLWTLKEAYVKALGRGFSAAPFKTFTIRFKAPTRGNCLSTDIATEASEIIVESFDDPKNLTSNWQFALVELAGSHYAAICIERAKTIEGGSFSVPMKLAFRRTIPLVEDESVIGNSVVAIGGQLCINDHIH